MEKMQLVVRRMIVQPGPFGTSSALPFLRAAKDGSLCGPRRTISSHAAQNDSKSSSVFLQAYKKTFDFPGATHGLNRLPAPSNSVVTLHGYLGSRADLSKKLSFTQLVSSDMSLSLQIKSSSKTVESNASHQKIRSLRAHTPVVVRGILCEKPPSKASHDEIKKIQHVELDLQDVQPLNEFPQDLVLKEDTIFPPEQRHLQMRNDKRLRNALQFRASAASICRRLLGEAGFVEIETPLLFKSTVEGAREFLVPTRRDGYFYALPQSPQQYKQILMGSGISKYFQIAKCFRDEDLRADRQPEFTQLDLELSFATGKDVRNLIETLIKELWFKLLHDDTLPRTFPTMTYEKAMSRYGSDKPDVRLGMEIVQTGYMLPVDFVQKISPISEPIVDAMKLRVSDQPEQSRKVITAFMDSPAAAPFLENPSGQPGVFIFDTKKPLSGLSALGFEAAEGLEERLDLEHGDIVILQARGNWPLTGGSTPMGNLRLALHQAAVNGGFLPEPKGYNFLWVTDFPLFSPSSADEQGQGGQSGLSSTHHPFTAPKTAEDVDRLATNPLDVKADHYDLVVNGVELGGGSRRIHDARVQEYILRDVVKVPEEQLKEFGHLLEVLRAGCPPHAGIALGFDRLVAMMLGKESVRDVIAFPKTGAGEDPLVEAPSRVAKEQLALYNLQLKT